MMHEGTKFYLSDWCMTDSSAQKIKECSIRVVDCSIRIFRFY